MRKFLLTIYLIACGACMAESNVAIDDDRDRKECFDSMLQSQSVAAAFGRLTESNRWSAEKWVAMKVTSSRGLLYSLLVVDEDSAALISFDTLLGLSIVPLTSALGNQMFDDSSRAASE